MSNVPRTPGKDGRPVSPFGPTVAEREHVSQCKCGKCGRFVGGLEHDPRFPNNPDASRPDAAWRAHYAACGGAPIECPLDGRPATDDGECPKCGRILAVEV